MNCLGFWPRTTFLSNSMRICYQRWYLVINRLMGTAKYSPTSNNMKLVHWPSMGGPLHLVQRGGDCVGGALASPGPSSLYQMYHQWRQVSHSDQVLGLWSLWDCCKCAMHFTNTKLTPLNRDQFIALFVGPCWP